MDSFHIQVLKFNKVVTLGNYIVKYIYVRFSEPYKYQNNLICTTTFEVGVILEERKWAYALKYYII